ncbi:hypothetical protein M1B74_07855 [Bacteroides pyogenes]|uniref:hypothetical protein n=1 Tax=Bacteroides pyogenes TaxID=310300 RepID=UPI003B42BA13
MGHALALVPLLPVVLYPTFESNKAEALKAVHFHWRGKEKGTVRMPGNPFVSF